MFDKYEQDIEQIVQVVFSTMLDVEAHRIQTPESSNESLAAFIQIAGEWNGSVMMGFTGPSATGCASQMLGVPAEELTDGDLRDVAAEVVNMVGGNFKGLLPGVSSLSLPTVIAGDPSSVHVHKAVPAGVMHFDSSVGPFAARLFEKAPSEVAS